MPVVREQVISVTNCDFPTSRAQYIIIKLKPKRMKRKTASCSSSDEQKKNAPPLDSSPSTDIVPPLESLTPSVPQTEIDMSSNPPMGTPTPASTSNVEYRYAHNSLGPFTVFVSNIDNIPLHPINFGRKLINERINDLADGGVMRLGRNRIQLTSKSGAAANLFANSSFVSANILKAFIPSFKMGLARGIDTDITEKDMIKHIEVPRLG